MNRQDVYREIKSQIKIEEYARKMGYTVVKKGRFFSLKEHDSVMIDPRKNCFWRNSEPGSGKSIGKGGSIIDFVCEFRGATLHEALKELSEEIDLDTSSSLGQGRIEMQTEKQEIRLPKQDGTMRNIYAYLIKTRGIDKEVVQNLVDRHMLYQDMNKNCVFISYDIQDKKKVVFGCRRGTNTYHPFYGDLAGCDYRQCFYYPNNDKERLYITESVIDMMSVMSLKKDRAAFRYLALAGVGKIDALDIYLSDARIHETWIGTDNDEPGRKAARLLRDKIQRLRPDIKIVFDLPKEGKDWNDVLKKKKGIQG